jgi:hypothetical protein
MAKTKISEFSSTPANNTDIDSINISEGCAPSGINDAIRELMAQLKDFQVGSAGDPVTVGGVLTVQAGSASTPSLTTAGDTNTGMFFPAADTIAFAEGGAEIARFDSSGNLGLGVTPSAWSTPAFNFGSSAVGSLSVIGTTTSLGNNINYNSGYKYTTSAAAGLYQISNNVHYWFNAPSGTAGNAITFTQAMTLDASGNLGVGTTSPSYRLDVSGFDATARINSSVAGGNSALRFLNGTGNNAAILFGDTDDDDVGFIQYVHSDNSLRVNVNASERARIDSSGNLLVGTASQISSGKAVISFGGTFFNGLVLSESANISSATFLAFNNGSTTIGSVSRVGGTSAVVYNTTSDYRLKTVTGSVTGQGARIDALKPIDYLWTEGGQQARGFLAHDFQTIYPNSVTGEKDAVDADGNPKYQSMQAATSEVIADLVAEIQSLRKRLADAGIA